MKTFSIVILSLALAASGAEIELPVGTSPPPVPVPHFPDTLHAVVWRNWDLVPTERIAKTVGATEEQIERIASAMGLRTNRPLDDKYKKQIYITVLRRNWHLLPYDQLLTLLDMTAEELAFGLREDDFLFHKLGQVKPRCAVVKYAEPDEETRQREAAIKAVVEKHFRGAMEEDGEERFAFIEQFSASPNTPSPSRSRLSTSPRYIYSYFGVFGDPLLDSTLDPYPDGLLARLAEKGVNGVWLHVVLRQLAPGGPDFPEFGEGWETRQENLTRLVQRAKKHGISVYLYMNEPRAQPEAFFKNRPEMAGVREAEFTAMCTTDPRVLKWMSDSLEHLFTYVPDLGGVFTITASENLTNCASHNQKKNCPRCSKLDDAKIIADVNAAIERGVHKGSPNAKVMLWDWGWALHEDAPQHIAQSPPNTWIQSVSEWSQPFERGGVKGRVGEYSMSVVGPGPRALLHWRLAKERGLKTVARVSFNNTWELSSVPWLPVLDLVAAHSAALAKADVDGLMLSWSTGGYPSPNLELARRIIDGRETDVNKALDAIATERYGKDALPHVRRAWALFSDAFKHFPYDGATLYTGPQQYGPANLLYEAPTRYGATMMGFPYDGLDSWRGQYAPEPFFTQWVALSTGWTLGAAELSSALSKTTGVHRDNLEADLRLALAAGTHWSAVANQVRFTIDRNALLAGGDAKLLKPRIATTIENEITSAKTLYTLAKQDSRIGFEASNHYYYTPLDMVEKVLSCEYLKKKFE